jgi:hypothetical protein
MAKASNPAFEGASGAEGGMLYNGVLCRPVIDKCQGCERVQDFEGQGYCASYPAPASKWTLGRCNFATHVRAEARAQAKVNPLKASKRAAKKK